jgi:hypothetical protein
LRRHCSYLDAEAMMSALQALGMLEGMGARQLGAGLLRPAREPAVMCT